MMAESIDKNIGFLGAGRMASALARGLIHAKMSTPPCIKAADVSPQARTAFAEATHAIATDSNRELAAWADLLVLAVKPQHAQALLKELSPALEGKLLISIAAGVTLAQLESALGEGVRVIRVMPNTPALVGAGASAYALGHGASREDGQITHRLLSSVGIAFEVPESQLDAVTGLSGSGPAYLFTVIEAMADGGVASGLPRELSIKLAAQTVLGAARMVLETGEHPAALKDAVASPGGTTMEGLRALESCGVRSAFIEAVCDAARRSKELGS